MTAAVPTHDIATILELEKARTMPPQKCHTIDKRGYALCGAFRRAVDEYGEWDRSDLHRRSDCTRRAHRHCVACDELNHQLGDDSIVG